MWLLTLEMWLDWLRNECRIWSRTKHKLYCSARTKFHFNQHRLYKLLYLAVPCAPEIFNYICGFHHVPNWTVPVWENGPQSKHFMSPDRYLAMSRKHSWLSQLGSVIASHGQEARAVTVHSTMHKMTLLWNNHHTEPSLLPSSPPSSLTRIQLRKIHYLRK